MEASYRLDQTYLQARIRPPFAEREDWSNYLAMANDPDMATIRDTLRRIMDRKGMKPTTLSLRVGANRTLVKDLLEKGKDVQIGTLTKLAGALDVSLSDLLAAPRIPVAGRIGAGGEIIFEDMGQDDTVARPPGISGSLVALVVTGSSMLPKYKDGDIIYIQREHDGLLPDYIGEDCAVRLSTGETYIKQLMRGSTDGRFTLLSLNAAPIEDVEIEWATPVLFIMPARSRQILS
jgi:phage repressor protein C with HTH and peptisase S24 domain